eukprot:Gb_33296 [translate_table: standard]
MVSEPMVVKSSCLTIYEVVLLGVDLDSKFKFRFVNDIFPLLQIGEYIFGNGGVVTIEELAPYLDVPPIGGNKEDASFVLPILLRFDGHPEVDSEENESTSGGLKALMPVVWHWNVILEGHINPVVEILLGALWSLENTKYTRQSPQRLRWIMESMLQHKQ